MSSILFTCAYSDEPLVQYPHPFEDQTILSTVREVAQHIGPNQSIETYSIGNLYYSSLSKNGIKFICVAVNTTPLAKISTFLQSFQKQWHERYGTSTTSNTGLFQNDFGPRLHQLLNPKNVDKIEQIDNNLKQIKEVMYDNVEKVIERGQNIESIVDKTHMLSESSTNFKSKATQLKRHMKCKRIKLWIIIGVSLAVLAFIIAAIICKGPHFPSCRSKSSPSPPPVNPPVTPPVNPPVNPPVTPPVNPPVTPPVNPPVTQPVNPPVNPPDISPILPPLIPQAPDIISPIFIPIP